MVNYTFNGSQSWDFCLSQLFEFFCWVFSKLTFFFKKFFQKQHEMFWIQFMPDILIWIQTVCICYQQMTQAVKSLDYVVVVFVFNVPPSAMVIWRRGHSLKSHRTSDRLLKPGIKPAAPGLQGKRFIHYTTAAPI